ncbi:MAG: DNA-processing protein DprA, partial [Eubacterium sp.]
LILTEFFMDTQPLAFHFPLRNRIISGLSQGLLVVEAAEKSGALITAKHALEQGKNVYAIPKDITLLQSVGCNNLIKDGAKVVTEVQDILEDYVDFVQVPDGEETVKSGKNLTLSEDEAKLFNLVARGYHTTDQLVLVSEKTIAEVNALLSMMELKDILRVDYGRVTLL